MEISFISVFDDNLIMSDKERKRGKKNTGLGLAIWILAIVILIIVFLVKSEDIKTNLKKTRFFERLFGKTPAFLAEDKKAENQDDENSDDVIDLKSLKKSDEQTELKKSQNEIKAQESKDEENSAPKETKQNKIEQKASSEESKQAEKSKNSKNKPDLQTQSKNEAKSGAQRKKDANGRIKTVQENKTDTTSRKAESKKYEEKSSEVTKKLETKAEEKSEEKKSSENKKTEAKTVVQNEKPATVAAKICFVAIDSDGPVIRKEVSRQVAKDSPLTESLNSLLAGPNATESKTGCRTLIPSGTKLYSAVVKNGTATLNFSEEFEFNTYGVEGFLSQLMQIVYTATNFSTVQNVQILIEGEKKEYLGSEGVWIGSPLSRASFR